MVMTEEEAVAVADRLGYPVLVRPSYVLGGQGMEIAYTEEDVREFMQVITRNKVENPVLVDKYMMGREIEVDAICDGDDILIPGTTSTSSARACTRATRSPFIRPSTSSRSTRIPSSATPRLWRRTSPCSVWSTSSSCCTTTRFMSSRSTVVPYRAVYLQGHRRAHGRSGHPLHVRRKARRYGLRHWSVSGKRPLCGQGSGILLPEAARPRHPAWTRR